MRALRWSPEAQMSATYSCCLALRGPRSPEPSMSAKPMMALRGVRSSWLMAARNELFWRLAASSSPRVASNRDRSARSATARSFTPSTRAAPRVPVTATAAIVRHHWVTVAGLPSWWASTAA